MYAMCVGLHLNEAYASYFSNVTEIIYSALTKRKL